MSNSISTTIQSQNSANSSATSSSRRPVARRACLSCREKKIKCDGEPISTIVSVDGSNKIIPQSTRICSNCKFLGIECVFVQSNRGGRRRKRASISHDIDDNTEEPYIEGPEHSKKFQPDSTNSTISNSISSSAPDLPYHIRTGSESANYSAVSPRLSSYEQTTKSSTDRLSSFILDQPRTSSMSSSRFRPISPAFSSVSTLERPPMYFSRIESSCDSASISSTTSGANAAYHEDYPRHYNPYGPTHPQGYPPPPPPPPPQGPHGPHDHHGSHDHHGHHGPPHHRHAHFNHRGPGRGGRRDWFDPYGPPPPPHQGIGYGPPPPPHQGMGFGHPPPPHQGMGYGPPPWARRPWDAWGHPPPPGPPPPGPPPPGPPPPGPPPPPPHYFESQLTNREIYEPATAAPAPVMAVPVPQPPPAPPQAPAQADLPSNSVPIPSTIAATAQETDSSIIETKSSETSASTAPSVPTLSVNLVKSTSESSQINEGTGKLRLPPIDGISVDPPKLANSEHGLAESDRMSQIVLPGILGSQSISMVGGISSTLNYSLPKSSMTTLNPEKIQNDTRRSLSSEQNSRLQNLSGSTNGQYQWTSSSSVPQFSDYELNHYDLPSWDILAQILDLYYAYQHPNHRLLVPKKLLLSKLSLGDSSSILHALIATTCPLLSSFSIDIPKSCDENYWIEKAFEYWDDLNDFGIILTYSLLSKTSKYRFRLSKRNEFNIKIWEAIYNKNYVEIYNCTKFELDNKDKNKTYTSRQIFERESIINLIWNFYVNDLILLRFNLGNPYFKLSSRLQDFKFNYELDIYSKKLLLPVELNSGSARSTWVELNDSSMTPSGSNSVIIAAKILEGVMTKISNEELTNEDLFDNTPFNRSFIKSISDKFVTVDHTRKLLVIDTGYLLSNFIFRTAGILQRFYLLQDILIFKLAKQINYTSRPGSDFIPLICEVDISDIAKFENDGHGPKILESITEEKWTMVFTMIQATLDFTRMVELFDHEKSEQELDSYLVAVGPTEESESGSSQTWFENSHLQTTIKEAWLKFPDFTLIAACTVLSVISNLVMLTKYIKVEKCPPDEDHSSASIRIKFLESSSEKEICIPVDEEAIKEFNYNNLLKRLSTLVEFVKTKLQITNESNMTSTIVKINKFSHYLEDIATNQ